MDRPIPKHRNNRGYLVETSDGKKGRTLHENGRVNGKVPVYFETAPHEYAEEGVLYADEKLKIIGYID